MTKPHVPLTPFTRTSPPAGHKVRSGVTPTEVTVRESVAEKSVRYLAEGRVKVRAVTAAGVKAEVQGSAEGVYHTRREGRRWTCDCPAWQRECCHVRAVRLVT